MIYWTKYYYFLISWKIKVTISDFAYSQEVKNGIDNTQVV